MRQARLLVGRLGSCFVPSLRPLEFLLRLAEAASQLRQLGPAEEQEDDEQDDEQLGGPRFMRRSFPRFSADYALRRGRMTAREDRSRVTGDRGGLPSRSGTGCGARRSGRCPRRRRRGRGGSVWCTARSSDRTASSGRRRRWPGPPATAATARSGACSWPPAGQGRSSPSVEARSPGASIHAVAGMLRSRTASAGRSRCGRRVVRRALVVRERHRPTSPGRSTPGGGAARSPIVVSVAVAGQHDGVGGQLGEQPVLDRADDGGEVAALEAGVARAAGEQRVAAEQDGRALDAGSTSSPACGRA